MAFVSQKILESMGFKFIGKNVKVSDKAAIYNADPIEIGDDSRIDDFCVISGKVKIGRNVHIAVFCNVAGGTEGITFDDFAGLAYRCDIFTQSDDYTGRTLTNPTVPSDFKRETKKPIHIGRHCIVGAGSMVFPGVSLGDGCSVGAMSMVTKTTESWGVYFGIPAKKIKQRKRDLLTMELEYLNNKKIDGNS